MDKKYYYVKGDSYSGDDVLYKLDINDINSLASFAITLDPFPEVRESDAYLVALMDFFKKNKNNLFNHFKILDSSIDSKSFFCTMIDLVLFEKRFRNGGLSEKSLSAYNNCIQKYQNQLKENERKYMQQEKNVIK